MISEPYSKLARIYDKVMSHVDYSEWAEFINRLLQYSEIEVVRMIDISCGTGKHLFNLNKKGAHLFGSDISREMIKIAKNKSAKRNTSFIVQDFSKMALKDNSFEAALMLYDSINYLMTENEIIHALNEVQRVLRPNGLFIFDIVTEEGLRDCFVDYYESDSYGALAYERHSCYSFKDKIQKNEFTFLYRGKSYKEIHQQKIWTIKELRKFIAKSNMKLSREFSNFSNSPANEKSERVHFICYS